MNGNQKASPVEIPLKHGPLPVFAVTGIDTEIGKTMVSSLLVAGLGVAYFKLVQAGRPEDRDKILERVPGATVHPNGLTLGLAASPHQGLEEEGRTSTFRALDVPLSFETDGLVELAGGVFCPLDEGGFMIDYLEAKRLPVVVAAKAYLGSINHTMLTLEALRLRGIPVLAVVVSGEDDYLADFLRANTKERILSVPFIDEDAFDARGRFNEAARRLAAEFLETGAFEVQG